MGVHRGDRGCQYTSQDFALFAERHGRGALDRVQGRVLGLQRRRRELLRDQQARARLDEGVATRELLRRAVFDYIEGWFNTKRLHSSFDYCSPAEWEAAHSTTVDVAA